jgi:predicted transcriptional regulator
LGNESRGSKRKQSKPVEVVDVKPAEPEEEEVTVYASRLFELNLMAQDAVREFALHDIDDTEGLEKKRVTMHDAFTELYDEAAGFIEAAMSQEFDVAYLRSKIVSAEGEVREQLSKGLKELEEEIQQNMSEMWMARVLAWLHQAAAASGPFVEREHEDKKKEASRHLAAVYSLLEKPFSAMPAKTDGAQKDRKSVV